MYFTVTQVNPIFIGFGSRQSGQIWLVSIQIQWFYRRLQTILTFKDRPPDEDMALQSKYNNKHVTIFVIVSIQLKRQVQIA